MTEERGVALAILGVVAVLAVVGLVLLFKGSTGQFVQGYGSPKIYPGHVVSGDVGPGHQYAGEGAYVHEQAGTCLSSEFFVQESIAGKENCRPGEMRVSVWQRNRKFWNAPDQTTVLEGWCCLRPDVRVPTAEQYPSFR